MSVNPYKFTSYDFLAVLKCGVKSNITSGDRWNMADQEYKDIQEQDLEKYVSNFDKFQSSASVRRQNQSNLTQDYGQELSREKILNLDKNKLVFYIYWKNVKKVARKFRNAYFYELSAQSLTELQKEALADIITSDEILAITGLKKRW